MELFPEICVSSFHFPFSTKVHTGSGKRNHPKQGVVQGAKHSPGASGGRHSLSIHWYTPIYRSTHSHHAQSAKRISPPWSTLSGQKVPFERGIGAELRELAAGRVIYDLKYLIFSILNIIQQVPRQTPKTQRGGTPPGASVRPRPGVDFRGRRTWTPLRPDRAKVSVREGVRGKPAKLCQQERTTRRNTLIFINLNQHSPHRKVSTPTAILAPGNFSTCATTPPPRPARRRPPAAPGR